MLRLQTLSCEPRAIYGALPDVRLVYFKPPVGNKNVWKKKNLQTHRKVPRPLWGCVTFLLVRKEKNLKKSIALADELSYSVRDMT